MTTVVVTPSSTTVRASPVQPTRITLNASTVAQIAQRRTPVSVSQQTTPVSVTDSRTSVLTGGAMGLQGPPGNDGSPGGTIPPIAFSFGDAAGTIYSPAAAGTLTMVRVVFETAFNGTSPALQIGTLAQPGAALSSAQNDPTESGEYEVTADLRLAAGEALRLTITPGAGASAGAGLIYLNFIPD